MREDYKDILNPYVVAEEQAEKRGFWHGVAEAAFYYTLAIIALGLCLAALDARASEWTFEESRYPIKASERGADITVCHSSGVRFPWACFAVKS